MNFERDRFFVSTDAELLDLDFVCRSLKRTPWAKNRPLAVIEESIRNSVCFGIYEKESRKQAGFARVVTDWATFSWVCDVIVDEPYRQTDMGKWLKACVAEHSAVKHDAIALGRTRPETDPATHGQTPQTVMTLTDEERAFLTS